MTLMVDMISYLTGAHNDAVASVAHDRNIGLLVQPGNRYDLQVHRYPTWAGDNGAFTRVAGGFDPDKFRAMLDRPNLRAAHEGRLVEYVGVIRGKLELCTYAAPTVADAHTFAATRNSAAVRHSPCLFVVAPDKLSVLPDGAVIGDALGTVEQFVPWAAEIIVSGFPVAMVAQDGLEHLLDYVRWDMLDVLFIGGSTEWKLSNGARRCVERARAEGKRTHMGRVNSYKRMAIAESWGVDTADGTFLAFGPTKNLPRLLGWLDKLQEAA